MIFPHMNDVLGHDSAVRLYWAWDNLGKWNKFVMNHAPGAGSITRLVDQQSSELPLLRMPLYFLTNDSFMVKWCGTTDLFD